MSCSDFLEPSPLLPYRDKSTNLASKPFPVPSKSSSAANLVSRQGPISFTPGTCHQPLSHPTFVDHAMHHLVPSATSAPCPMPMPASATRQTTTTSRLNVVPDVPQPDHGSPGGAGSRHLDPHVVSPPHREHLHFVFLSLVQIYYYL